MKIHLNGETLTLKFSKYANGQNRIDLIDEVGFPYSCATVAIKDAEIPANCIAVKDYSEGVGTLDALIKGGIVEKPHQQLRSGYVVIPVCKFTPQVLTTLQDN